MRIGLDSEWAPGYYLACAQTPDGSLVFNDKPALRAYLADLPPGTEVCLHSALADFGELGYYPAHLVVLDSYKLSWLLNENGTHGLKDLAPRYLGLKLDDPISVGKDKVVRFFGTPIIEADQSQVVAYCVADADASLKLVDHLLKRLPEKVLKWYHEVERPLDHALFKMRQRGVGIDTEALAAEVDRLSAEVPAARQAVFDLVGYEFQLSSAATQELEFVLYETSWTREQDHKGKVGYYKSCVHGKNPDKCKVPDCTHLPRERFGWVAKTYPGLGLECLVATASGGRATSEEALLHHAGHPVVKAVLDYRELVKVQQFLLSWTEHSRDGRLYPGLDSVGTVTGRFSCRTPNLQQVPKRGALGKRMRSLFIPEPGNLMVVCDQDSIEARLMSAFARQESELVHFRAGADVHQALADELSTVLHTLVTRDAAKTVRYALLYGAGAKRLAATLTRYGVPTTVATAKRLIQAFYTVLPQVQKWQKAVEAAATRTGTIHTLGGRIRHLTGTWSNSPDERARALRQAGNSVVQGSAADITKRWIVALDKLDVPMVLTVHDEVLVDSPPELAPLYAEWLEETLLDVGKFFGIACPITGTAHWGASWGEAKG